jgi:hypothetical protein
MEAPGAVRVETARTNPSDLGLGTGWWDLIARRAARTPEATMLTDERGRALTFGGFRDAADRRYWKRRC